MSVTSPVVHKLVGNRQVHNSKAHFENIGILLKANFLVVNDAYSEQESE